MEGGLFLVIQDQGQSLIELFNQISSLFQHVGETATYERLLYNKTNKVTNFEVLKYFENGSVLIFNEFANILVNN